MRKRNGFSSLEDLSSDFMLSLVSCTVDPAVDYRLAARLSELLLIVIEVFCDDGLGLDVEHMAVRLAQQMMRRPGHLAMHRHAVGLHRLAPARHGDRPVPPLPGWAAPRAVCSPRVP